MFFLCLTDLNHWDTDDKFFHWLNEVDFMMLLLILSSIFMLIFPISDFAGLNKSGLIIISLDDFLGVDDSIFRINKEIKSCNKPGARFFYITLKEIQDG